MNKKGFTIIEIVIALAVFIIGVTSCVNLFPVGLYATKRAGDFSSAGMLAQEKMAELLYLGYDNWDNIDSDFDPTAMDRHSGKTGDAKNPFPEYPEYKWHIDVRTHSVANLAKITLWVYWNDRGNERNDEFVTYIADRD